MNLSIESLEACRPMARGLVARILHGSSEVDAVTNLAVWKAFRGQKGFRGDCQLSTWVSGIARREALMWLRNNKRYQREVVLEDMPTDFTPEDWYMRKETLEDVLGHIASLPTLSRRALLLRLYHGDLNSVAAELGVTVHAVKSRILRGRKILRDSRPS